MSEQIPWDFLFDAQMTPIYHFLIVIHALALAWWGWIHPRWVELTWFTNNLHCWQLFARPSVFLLVGTMQEPNLMLDCSVCNRLKFLLGRLLTLCKIVRWWSCHLGEELTYCRLLELFWQTCPPRMVLLGAMIKTIILLDL